MSTCTWPGCDRPHWGGGYCTAHYKADWQAGQAPPLSRFDEFLWLTETMGCGWADAARRCGYNTYEAIYVAARRHGRDDLAKQYLHLHNAGEKP